MKDNGMNKKIEFIQPEYRRTVANNVIPPQEKNEAMSDKATRWMTEMRDKIILSSLAAGTTTATNKDVDTTPSDGHDENIPREVSQVVDMYRNWYNKLTKSEDSDRCPNISLDEMVEALIIKYNLDDNATTRETLRNIAKCTVGYTVAPFDNALKSFCASHDKSNEV